MILAPLLGAWLLLGMLVSRRPRPRCAPPPRWPVPWLRGSGGTALGRPTATPLPVPTAATGFVTVAGQPLPEVRPKTLDLGGRVFLVYVAPVQDGNWLVRPDPSVANWLPGATANWAFALFVDGGDRADAAWLARLQPGTPRDVARLVGQPAASCSARSGGRRSRGRRPSFSTRTGPG